MTDVAALTVEERLAILEQRLAGPSQLALVPPITVGALTNVPAPGSQLAAQWAQDASGMVVHRFPNKAALAAWTGAAVGTFAVQADTGVLWRKVATGWTQQSPWTAAVAGIGITTGTAQVGTVTLATVAVPADPGPRVINASCHVHIDKFQPAPYVQVLLYAAGVLQVRKDIPPEADSQSAQRNHTYYVDMAFAGYAANVGVTNVSVQLSTIALRSECMVPNDYSLNRLDVTVLPRGY